MFQTGAYSIEPLRKGRYIMENGKSSDLSGDLNINYNHAFGQHNVFANAGYFVSESKYQAYQHIAEGFANNSVADATFARQYAKDTTPTGKDRKSTRLNSSHANISYAVFCLKNKYEHPSHVDRLREDFPPRHSAVTSPQPPYPHPHPIRVAAGPSPHA